MIDEKHVQPLLIKLIVNYSCRIIEGLMINARCEIVLSALMIDEKHVQTLVIKLIINYSWRIILRV